MISQRHGVTVFDCPPDGPVIRTGQDALDLIVGDALYQGAGLVAVPVDRLDAGFFTLASGIAGEIVQKFVNYRLRLAVVGDIGPHLDRSSALRDFVRESNRGRQTWFVADLAELDERLAAEAR